MEIKEKLIEKLKKWVKETNVIEVDESDYNNTLLGWKNGYKFNDKKLETLRDGKIKKEVYVITFKTKDVVKYNIKNGEIDIFIEGMSCYAYFDAETLDLMYIHKKAGYIEVDGTY
jgi:hypothetical protein